MNKKCKAVQLTRYFVKSYFVNHHKSPKTTLKTDMFKTDHIPGCLNGRVYLIDKTSHVVEWQVDGQSDGKTQHFKK
jgi:hypothetical protein